MLGHSRHGPHLIVHGTKDMAVAFEEAELLRADRTADDGCELLAIDGGTHTFGLVHPFAGATPHLEVVIERCVG
jgi:pimeloyl-ACP methyl ester carboxylesterase